MEFTSLNANGTRSVVMHTRATQGHRLEFQSTEHGHLLPARGAQLVNCPPFPFVLAVDGQTFTLSQGTVLRIQGDMRGIQPSAYQ